MSNAPPPKLPPHGVTDPYTDWFSDASTPPNPGPLPSGERSLLRFHVPAENTAVDLGYGSPTPGIRMSTAHHVHLTALDPLTTISLGTPGGEGIGEPPGLQLYTAGEKRETIEKAVVENYKDKKSETVHSSAEEKFLADKTEIVSGRNTQNLFDEHHFGVKKDATYNYDANKAERVVGNWTVEVMGHKKETIHGDKAWLSKGNYVNVTYGSYNDFFFGEKLTASIAANFTLHLGASISASMAYQQNFVGGNKHEVVLGTGLTMNESVKIAVDNIRFDKALGAYKDIVLEKKTGELELFTTTYGIKSSTLTIFK